jgi:hypothetical protein
MRKRNYKIEWLIIVMAVISVLISAVLDIYIENRSLFARSGAIAVLLAAIVEYRISSHIYDDIYRAGAQQKFSGFPTRPTQPKNRSFLSLVTHSTLIIGTIIWGYGDLFWP